MKSRIKKLLGIILSVVIVMSVCICAVVTSAASKEITYYVKANGSDSATGLTASESLKTISQAIKNAIDGGFSSGDTVYVNLVNYNEINWGTARNYNFDLVVRANSEELRNTVVIPTDFTFGGDTSFQSVIVKNIKDVYYGNHNVSFDENCTFNVTNQFLGNKSATAAQTVNEPQTVYMGNTVVSDCFRLSDNTATKKTYANDVTAVFDDAKSTPKIYLAAAKGETVFAKNLNINVMQSKSVAVSLSGGKVTLGGALQFIVNSATKVSDESVAALKSLTATDKFYYIVNASGVDDLINTTETAGKYLVNTQRYKVIATDEEGAEHIAKDGVLSLPKAGRYVVKTVKIIETATYYVSASGSDEKNGTTSSNAVATIARAVELANAAGYLEGDLITIKVARKNILDSTGGSMGVLPKYSFDLVVESASSQRAKIIIAASDLISNNEGSTTYYKNIEFNNGGTQWSSARLNSSNVIFDSNVKFDFGFGTSLTFGTGNDGGAGKTIAGQKVEIGGAAPYSVSLTNGAWSGRTYTEDVNLVINSSTANPFIYFNSYYEDSCSGSTKYLKNVNINLKSISGVRLSRFDGATFDGAIQIINSAGISFDKTYTYSGATTTPLTVNQALAGVTADKYLINNNTGDKEIISFTETAGKFAVDTGKYKLTATGTNSKTYHSENGYLVLEEPGVYTLTLNHTHTYTNDCDEICNSCSDVRTNAHVYTNACDATCDVCGKVRNNNHVYDHGCDKTCNICFMTRDTSHVYKGVCDADCDVCLEVRTASEHVFTNSCDVFCNVCNFERAITHTYLHDCDAVCDICGFERIPHDHVYYNTCDENCNVCGFARTVEHTFDNDCDKHCNECGISRKTLHKYNNACDSSCNVCGYTRAVKHTYSNNCDESCNVCGEQRKAHIYDNNCDRNCNVCNKERTVIEHVFDSTCDTTCAECGTTRQSSHTFYSQFIANKDSHWTQCELCGYKHQEENHIFDNDCDRKCDTCGYMRVAGNHTFDNDCDANCNGCDYVRAVVHEYSGECDTDCDLCGYIREGAGHRGGTATCREKAICEVCGLEYGEKDGEHIGEIEYHGKIAVKCNADGYTGDGYCIACNKLAIPGSIIPATGLHKYSTECDTSCNTCGETRETTHQFAPATCTTAKKCLICNTTSGTALDHNYLVKYQKATDQNDGRQWEECDHCGLTRNEKVLSKIATVKLVTESFIYDGTEKVPTVIVKGANGVVISAECYNVTYIPAVEVGTYIVKIKFKNGYSGIYTLSFRIVA